MFFRSNKAGKLLAEVLLKGLQGNRYFTISFSFTWILRNGGRINNNYLWVSGLWHLLVTLLGQELFSNAYSVWLKQKMEVGISSFFSSFVFDMLDYLYIKLIALFYVPLSFQLLHRGIWFCVGYAFYVYPLNRLFLLILWFTLLLAAELVERVVLLGAPVPIKDENWEAARKVYMGNINFLFIELLHLFYQNNFFPSKMLVFCRW